MNQISKSIGLYKYKIFPSHRRRRTSSSVFCFFKTSILGSLSGVTSFYTEMIDIGIRPI